MFWGNKVLVYFAVAEVSPVRQQGRGGGGWSAEEAAEAVRHRVRRMAEAHIDLQVSDKSQLKVLFKILLYNMDGLI